MLNLLFALSAFACPDFSGHYVSQDEDIDIVLDWKQDGCASAFGRYDYGSGGYVNERTMTFDGVARALPDDGSYELTEGLGWDGDAVVVEGAYRSKVPGGSRHTTRGRIYFDSARNLLEDTVYFDENGKEMGRSTYHYRRAR